MQRDFNLSEELINDKSLLLKSSVKEFIRLLKEELVAGATTEDKMFDNGEWDGYNIMLVIDKLAGEELSGVNE